MATSGGFGPSGFLFDNTISSDQMSVTMLTCTKLYADIPFAHRQHLHDGHCAKIHGHNWSFEFTFAADRPDANGFVIDFGKLKKLKVWLDLTFDHALLLNETDPRLRELHRAIGDVSRIIVVDNCSCEGLAVWLMRHSDNYLPKEFHDRGGRIVRVRVIEDSKNFATLDA